MEARDAYQEAIDCILGSQTGAAEALDKALGPEPTFAAAAAARYLVAKDARDPDAARFKNIAEEASADARDWERSHVDILLRLIDAPGKNIADARAHIEKYPADLLVISQLAGYFFFYGGAEKRHAVLELLESVEHALTDDWAHLNRLGFAASEIGDRARGRELIERALEARPEAMYSIHGLAHVLHDEGAVDESAKLLGDWLQTHEVAARGGWMYSHVQWHMALAEWQQGKTDGAMERYGRYCAPGVSTCGPVLTLADCGGLLIRRMLSGAGPTPLSEQTTSLLESVSTMLGHPFIALHVAGLYATAGDDAGLRRCEEAISASSPGTNQDVSLALVSAFRRYVDGDLKSAHAQVSSLSAGIRVGIGGSNVERQLVDLVESACAQS